MEKLRILLADDHSVVRQGLRRLIESQPGWTVCGEASTGRETVQLAEELKPDIVVIDMGMPELNGLDATRQIKKTSPQIEVIMFTGQETEELIVQVFEAGARAYIRKTDVNEHLFEALRSAAQHKPYFTSDVGEIIFAKFLHRKGAGKDDKPQAGRLSGREREIVQLLSEGLSNKEVGSKLGVSVKTVETHRAAIMKKLGLDSFSELVRYAIRNHIIEA
jgi:DNA-binding NarL/FixJ family response regulator